MKNRYNVPSKADQRTWGTLSAVYEVQRNPYGVKRIPKEFLFAAHGLRAQTLPQEQVEFYRMHKTSGFLPGIEGSRFVLDEGIAGVVPGLWRVSRVRAGSMRSDVSSEEVYTWDVELERLGS
jgi:hypothetical protein